MSAEANRLADQFDAQVDRAEMVTTGSVMAWLRWQRNHDPARFAVLPAAVLLDDTVADDVKRRFIERHRAVAAEV